MNCKSHKLDNGFGATTIRCERALRDKMITGTGHKSLFVMQLLSLLYKSLLSKTLYMNLVHLGGSVCIFYDSGHVGYMGSFFIDILV